MVDGLKSAGKEDILALGYAFAGLVYNTETDKQWLKRRFEVFHSMLEDSWSYQEMVQKGIDQGLEIGKKRGIEQGIKQGELKVLKPILMRLIEMRFPQLLTTLAQQRVELITEPTILSAVVDKLLTVETLDQARQILSEIDQISNPTSTDKDQS